MMIIYAIAVQINDDFANPNRNSPMIATMKNTPTATTAPTAPARGAPNIQPTRAPTIALKLTMTATKIQNSFMLVVQSVTISSPKKQKAPTGALFKTRSCMPRSVGR